MCDGIKTYALGYWICVMVLKRSTRVLDMCDGSRVLDIKAYALRYWICVMVKRMQYWICVCTRVLDMCDDIKTYTLGSGMCHGIKAYALGYWICVMVLKRMHPGTGHV